LLKGDAREYNQLNGMKRRERHCLAAFNFVLRVTRATDAGFLFATAALGSTVRVKDAETAWQAAGREGPDRWCWSATTEQRNGGGRQSGM
jgi:hypothetical protein